MKVLLIKKLCTPEKHPLSTYGAMCGSFRLAACVSVKIHVSLESWVYDACGKSFLRVKIEFSGKVLRNLNRLFSNISKTLRKLGLSAFSATFLGSVFA